jgi:redox-sensitive bicupin YhaK (pirin superfamily)
MIRNIDKILKSRPTIEGAGVHLDRVFGYHEVPLLDPFLLLDDFHSDNPDDYIAGFPWHPHRGIETVTYMMEGKVEHGDSMGNEGVIESGDCQWMTAGSGIIHQEMPKAMEGMMAGFQLWVNLPASQKMMTPRYQEIKASTVPEVLLGDGIKVRVVCGDVGGVKGPVTDIVVDPEYLDVSMPPTTEFIRGFKPGYKVFAYVILGSGYFEPESKKSLEKEHLVIYKDGDEVRIKAGDEGARFLLISGKPLNQPVAWYGPIVMNTQEELDQAFREYREGTFIKDK